MGETRIPYSDITWDLTIGCRKRSPGCENCWATRTVHRLAAGQPRYRGQTTADGRDWLQNSAVTLVQWNLPSPSRCAKPQFIFVNSKSDLFDERVPYEYIGQVFDRMWSTRQHQYMVCTKNPGRLGEFIAWYQRTPGSVTGLEIKWPDDFPHVILMTSIEDAEHLDRWDQLRQIPASLRGISVEPLLGPVGKGLREVLSAPHNPLPDWIIVGCEKLLGGRAGRWAGEDPESWWGAAAMIAEICRRAATPPRLWLKQGPILRRGRVVVTNDMAEFPGLCRIQERPHWSL